MSQPRNPVHFELWANHARTATFHRRFNFVLLGLVALLAFALVLMATRPLLAVRVDQLGRAELVSNIAPSNAPGPEEAEQVSRLVSQYLLEVTSGSVRRDVGHALGLMTQKFAGAYRDLVKEDPMLAKLEQGNIRTSLTFDPALTQVKVEKDKAERPVRYFVQLGGVMEVFRQDAFTKPLMQRPVRVRATLLVVPRGPATLNGLLVDHLEKDFPEAPPADAPLSANPLPSAPAKDTR